MKEGVQQVAGAVGAFLASALGVEGKKKDAGRMKDGKTKDGKAKTVK